MALIVGTNTYATEGELAAYAAALGFVGSTNGVAGHVIAQCKALLDKVLPLKTVTSNDVAILAIGRNNVSGGIDATEMTDFGLCIDKLLAKGYGKVLVRAVLPQSDGSTTWAAENAALKSVMDAKLNPSLVWIDTSTWIGYDSPDKVHPSKEGYVTITAWAVPAYSAAIGL